MQSCAGTYRALPHSDLLSRLLAIGRMQERAGEPPALCQHGLSSSGWQM